jgi:hypothetical protein
MYIPRSFRVEHSGWRSDAVGHHLESHASVNRGERISNRDVRSRKT